MRLQHISADLPPEFDITNTQKSTRLPGLEALRFVAALCVLLLHTRAVFGGVPVFGRGYLGVDFFLMLSGFLMTRVQEPRLADGMAPWPFLAKRYRRLWPTMAAGGLIGIPMQVFRSHDLGQFILTFGANMMLLPVFGQPFVFPLNIPAWTIFYEMVANGLHVLLLHRLRGRWLLMAIMALVPIMVWVGMRYHSFDVGAKPSSFVAGLPRIIFAYLLGIALARWWQDNPPLPALPYMLHRYIWPLLALIAMPAILVLGWWLGVRGWWFDLAFVTLACPLMIAGALCLRSFTRTATLIGQLSFPLFALQMPVLQGLKQLHFSYWIGFFAACLAGIIGAVMAHQLSSWKTAKRSLRKTENG